MADSITRYIRLTRDRSTGNTRAISSLYEQELYGQAVGMLRQELDSLIKICYLLTIGDLNERLRLIDSALSNTKWRLREIEMVNIASRYNHWAPEVYEFGNQFIHLTDYHDYKTIDPLINLASPKKQIIKNYLSIYHHFPQKKEINFENIVKYIPEVGQKISRNLNIYLNDLANNRQL